MEVHISKRSTNVKVDYVYRINLKTGGSEAMDRIRPGLINFCLENPHKQYVAIGWSYVYKESPEISTYEDYFQAVKASVKRLDASHNIFYDAEENSILWTRDMNGDYWICRSKGTAESYCNAELDIGAVIPVEAYKYGHEVPGQIKSAFNRPNAGTAQRIYGKSIFEFSKYAFNKSSGRKAFLVDANSDNDIIGNLPDFDLEELVISYIQIKYNYYVLSNSIANKSTTIKIECEFRSRYLDAPTKAVVQVKAGDNQFLNASDFEEFVSQGYYVFLYCPKFNNDINSDKYIWITREQLYDFYVEYKSLLPESITIWENLFCL